MFYKKCNPETNYGWKDLIFEAMSALDGPATSGEIWTYACATGMTEKLWAEGQVRPATPRSTFYARINEAYRKSGGFVARVVVDDVVYYELIPGRSPQSVARKLDYTSRDCYVYLIRDAVTVVPAYAGMGRGSRKDVHLTVGSHNAALNAAVAEIRAKGREPEVVVIQEGLTRTEALRLEAEQIALYGRRHVDTTGVLFNRLRGSHAL